MKDYEHVVIWLDYFNKNLKKSKGRRLGLEKCIFDPSLKELIDATKSADTAPEPVAKQTAGQTATFGPKGTNPNPKLYAGIVAEGKGVKDKKTPAKSLGPKAVGKNYKNGYYGK